MPRACTGLAPCRGKPLVLAGEVEAPVLLEVAVADHGAQGEDGFGAVQAPSGSADVRLSPIRWRHAPSMTPVAIGQPAARAWS